MFVHTFLGFCTYARVSLKLAKSKSSRNALFILCYLIQALRANFLGDTGVVFPKQAQLSNTDLASRGNLSATPSMATNRNVHFCVFLDF